MLSNMESHTVSRVAVLIAGFLIILLVRAGYWHLTDGVQRRKLIRQHGCKPPRRYRNKGLLGKLLGLDYAREQTEASKHGRLHLQGRVMDYSDQNTIQNRIYLNDTIMTIEPENLKCMLSTNFSDYSLRPLRCEALIPFLGPGIFDTNGAAWAHSRALLRPSFNRKQIADLDTFEKHVSNLIERIPCDGSTVNLEQLFFTLTVDAATDFFLGKSTNLLAQVVNSKEAEDFVSAFDYCARVVTRQIYTNGWSAWIPDPKWKQELRKVHQFAEDQVYETLRNLDQEKSAAPDSYVFLHELLKETKDPLTLRSEFLNVFLAGRDTTATFLTNTWHILCRRPDVWSKLQAEIDDHVDRDEQPSYEQIKAMKYLRHVLDESLRLMPVVPNSSRTAIRDTVLPLGGGENGRSPLFIPKGMQVNFSIYALHRLEEFYGPAVMEFKPERWDTLRPRWEYLPFSGGPRICLGQQFALLEASYCTIRMMQRFWRVEPREERRLGEFLHLTFQTGKGCNVAVFEK